MGPAGMLGCESRSTDCQRATIGQHAFGERIVSCRKAHSSEPTGSCRPWATAYGHWRPECLREPCRQRPGACPATLRLWNTVSSHDCSDGLSVSTCADNDAPWLEWHTPCTHVAVQWCTVTAAATLTAPRRVAPVLPQHSLSAGPLQTPGILPMRLWMMPESCYHEAMFTAHTVTLRDMPWVQWLLWPTALLVRPQADPPTSTPVTLTGKLTLQSL